MNNLQSLNYYWPELILVTIIITALIYDLLIKPSESQKVGLWVFAGLVLTLFANWFTSAERTTTLFSDSLALDPFAQFFKTLIIVSTLFIILMSRKSEELRIYRTGEYYTLISIMVFGMFLMVSAIDLIMVYLSIEVVSISSFILAGYLKQDQRSNESSLKYVIYGAFSSGLMLFGLSILFGLTGTTKFFEIQNALAGLDTSSHFALIIASVFILAGFGYKISAVPFHFWTPDVYEGAPTPVTAYLSVAPKAAGFALLIRFFHTLFTDGGLLFESENGISTIPWPQVLAVISVATMTLGNLVAIQQSSVKRMLAYSSIAHAGYMLMAIPILSGNGVYAIMIYLVMYLFMNLGAFFVVIVVKNKTGGETFEDFRGLGWEMPIVGIAMALFMLSLTGIPPTAGFIGKFYIFAAVIKAGPAFYWLVFAGAINSVISLYYYMHVVKVMFLEGDSKEKLLFPSFLESTLIITLAVPTLLLGIYWTPIADWISNSLRFFHQGM
jgi:NADH-quinone oxidoreductase subunit N